LTRLSKSLIRVQGFHLDRYGHVNNARYLEFLETGRWDFIREYLDMHLLEQKQWGFFISQIDIHYKKPAHLDDIVLVQTAVHEIGSVKTTMRQQIFHSETNVLLVEAYVTFAMMHLPTQKVLRLKGEVLNFLS